MKKKKNKIYEKQLEIIQLFGKVIPDNDYDYKIQRN